MPHNNDDKTFGDRLQGLLRNAGGPPTFGSSAPVIPSLARPAAAGSPPVGLLGRIGTAAQGLLSGVQNVVSSPVVQGVGAAAATGFNPLVGLLAAPGIQSDRDRRSSENELLRQEVLLPQRRRRQAIEMINATSDLPFAGTSIGGQRLAPLTGDEKQFLLGLAEINPDAAIQALGEKLGFSASSPGPTSLQRNLVAAGIDPHSELGRSIALQDVLPEPEKPSRFQEFSAALGREPTQDEVLNFFSGGTTINIGDKESQKPIPVTQLPNVRMPDGSPVPLGTTFGEAAEAGARVFSAAEIAKKDKLTTALGVVGDLKTKAIGPNGVFVGVPNNVIGRAVEGAANIFGDLAGTQASIKRDAYTSLAQGTLAPLARSLGETGALATEDAARALQLLADIEGIPEGEDLAREKFAQLEEIFLRGLKDFDTSSDALGGPGGHFRYNPATGQLEPL